MLPSDKLRTLYESRNFHSSKDSIAYVDKILNRCGKFVDREFAETSEEFKQVVAVGIVRCGDKVLCVRRTKKSNRRALRLRWTLMFGGHVDDVDQYREDPPLSCLMRELKEELGLTPTRRPELIGFAVDPENDVGRLHIGFVFDVQVESATLHMHRYLDNSEFVNANREKFYIFMSEAEVRVLSDKLDPWSFIFIASAAVTDHCNWSAVMSKNPELPLRWD